MTPSHCASIVALASAFVGDAVLAAAGPTCVSETPTFDSQAITCAIEGAQTSQRYRLKANFAGGHDDTKASLVASLDGRPIDCAPGSKTSLFGEDGDVSLWCDVDSTMASGRSQFLKVTVTYGHAQYVDFVFGGR